MKKLISDLKQLSNKIIVRALPIMRIIESEDNEYVSTLVEEILGLDKAHALEVLQDVALEWVKDAETVKIEADIFLVSDGDEFSVTINTMEKCPMLSEIWNGDAYDKMGNEGLRELKKELENQFETISEEYLLKKARVLLLGEDANQ